MALSKLEQETIITYNAEEKEAHIYTADPAMMRKLSSNSQYKHIKDYVNGGRVVAKDFTFDKKLITLRSKRVKISMTDEQKAASAERLKAVNEARRQKSILS